MDMRFEAKLFQSIKVLIYFSSIHTAAAPQAFDCFNIIVCSTYI